MPSAGGWHYVPKMAAKSRSGQPIYENSIHNTEQGVIVQLPADDADGRPRVYLFPVRFRVTDNWSDWRVPAQLDRGDVPKTMDRHNVFRSLDRKELSSAPRIRWRAEYYVNFNEARGSGYRYIDIPPC